MAYLHSTCPVCNTIIEDINKKECNNCGWILKVENLLDQNTNDLLLDWATHYYERVKELESRGKYHKDKLNNRLNNQRDDIDHLKHQVASIFILLAKEASINQSDNITDSFTHSINNIDQNVDFTEIVELDSVDVGGYVPIQPSLAVTSNIASNSILMQDEDLDSPTSDLSQSQQDIISDYYNNPSEFANKYQVEVANLTKDSINSNRGNEEKIVVLEESNRGNYWIFNFDNCIYLTPVEGKYINQHSYITTSAIFDGDNYTPGYEKVQLLKPAIVTIDMNSNPRRWRLKEQGKLLFL